MEKEKEKSIKQLKEKLQKGKRVNSTELENIVETEYNEKFKE